MPTDTGLQDLPFEVQLKILGHLGEKDLVSMHRVSTGWRSVICLYMEDVSIIKKVDWRWFCRHSPQVAQCTQCLLAIRSRDDIRGFADDWRWWI